MFWKKKKRAEDPFALDWGAVTPELANHEQRTAVHVLNHALSSSADRERTIRFLNGRLAWYRTQLPPGWAQRVNLDDRGQTIDASGRGEIRQAVQGAAALDFMSGGQG